MYTLVTSAELVRFGDSFLFAAAAAAAAVVAATSTHAG